MTTRSLGLSLLVALAFAEAAAAEDVRAAVVEVNRQWAAALARGDAAALAALYSKDAMLLAPGAEAARGPEAIRAAAQGLIDSGVAVIELDTREVESCGDLAFESGAVVLKKKDGSLVDRGKYVVVWKKEGGRWKLHRDIFNSNAPPPAH